MKKRILRRLLTAALLAVSVLLVIRLNSTEKTALVSRRGQSFEKGVVTAVLRDNLQEDGMRVGQQLLIVRMTTGPLKGQLVETTSNSGYLFGAPCKEGMRVVVMQSVSGDVSVTSVYSQDRGAAVWIFAALYLAALCVIGGRHGAKGAAALVFTFGCILFVYLPIVYRGYPPFGAAVFICVLTTAVTFLLIGGATLKSLVASLGTVSGVVASGLIAKLFSLATGLSGWNVSDIESLLVLWYAQGIRVGDLLFSGLLISTLGAVMDVAMSIASAMWELKAQSPAVSRRELFLSGMRIGRDMMGTDSNTLILAFTGGSVSMCVLDYAYALPYLQIVNSANIGIAIMQGLSGSFAVVLCVPVTVALAALIYTPRTSRAP